jgi:hypothetical protein
LGDVERCGRKEELQSTQREETRSFTEKKKNNAEGRRDAEFAAKKTGEREEY